jgi:hypothetical protein
MKLRQVRLCWGAYEFCVPHPRLAGASIISRLFSVLASLGQRDRGHWHLLLYVDDFPAVASTSAWLFFFKISPTRALLRSRA